LYLYAFANPNTGASFWPILPKVKLQLMAVALKEFASWLNLGKKRRVALAMDRAGWHKSAKLPMPVGIHPIFIPPLTPELQPAEPLWSLSDEPLANRSFDDLNEFEDVLYERCRRLLSQRDLVKSRTQFHWWPQPGR
jgi:hypothetical protein